MQQITYSPDTAALLAEIEQIGPGLIVVDDNGDKAILTLKKVPTVRSGNETVSVVKDLPAELQSLTNLKVLADKNGAPYEAQAVFVDDAAQETYERVTGVLVPQKVPDDEGNMIDQAKPYLIGVIA